MGGWKPIDHEAFIGETCIFSCLFFNQGEPLCQNSTAYPDF